MKTSAHLLVDLQGTELSPEERELIAHPGAAGVILFAHNYENLAQLKALTRSIRRILPTSIIAVDQEGGRVQRFIHEFTVLPSMSYWGKQYDQDPHACKLELTSMILTMATELKAAGITMDLMPVLDVNHHLNPMIGERSIHQDPRIIIELGKLIIDRAHDLKLAVTGKHFPGHGSVSADSHHALPIDERDFDSVWEIDIQPFVGLAPHLDAIMPAHILFPNIHPLPAGFSNFWLQDILRQRLKFEGVIVTDDLSMQGAVKLGSVLDRAEMALSAGCDLLCLCKDRQGTIQVLQALEGKYRADSQQRIQKLKSKSCDLTS